MKIEELEDGINVDSLEATVQKNDEGKQVNTKYGSSVLLRKPTIQDETGTILLVLWGEEPKIEEGDKIRIEKGFVNSWQDELQLNVPRSGKVEVVGRK